MNAQKTKSAASTTMPWVLPGHAAVCSRSPAITHW